MSDRGRLLGTCRTTTARPRPRLLRRGRCLHLSRRTGPLFVGARSPLRVPCRRASRVRGASARTATGRDLVAKTAAPKPPRLTKKELVEDRMCLRSAKLVDEVYDLAKRQMASEDRRETNLSAKAVSLLSVTGLSLTVAFTFGGVLLQRPAYLAALGPWRTPLVVVPYAFALLSGMAASWYALRSLKVRPDYREVSE